MRTHDVKSPAGNDLTDPVEFNLMFDSSIGPTGQQKGCVSFARGLVLSSDL